MTAIEPLLLRDRDVLSKTLPETSEAVLTALVVAIVKPLLSVSFSATVYVPTNSLSPVFSVRSNNTEAPLSNVIVKLVPTFSSLASVIVAVNVTTSSTPTRVASPTVEAVIEATTGAVVSVISTVTVVSTCALDALPNTSFRKPSETVIVSTFVPVPPNPERACSTVVPIFVSALRTIVSVLALVLTTAVLISSALNVSVGTGVVPTAFQVNLVQSR